MFRSMLCLLFMALSLAYAANPYEVSRFQDENGKTIVAYSIPGRPPALRISGPVATPSRSAVVLTDVPKLNWVYGCTATSAAMIAGYYDRNGYPNMYTGPTNGGLFPSTNAAWGNGECSLSATHQGYDGLGVWGHVDRFWTGYNNSGDDPFGTASPTGTYANCTADYIGTNQDWWNNSDGASTVFSYEDGTPLINYSGNESANPRLRDAIRGFRLFMESRGYSVSTNFNQKIYGYEGNTNGYTLAQFRQSIDNGIPVMIQVVGHTMVGVGYESTNSTIYIHDTWDHSLHSMTWGGSYEGMQHYMVSVLQLASAPLASGITWNPASFSQTLELGGSATRNLVIGNTGTGTLSYQASVPGGEETALQENFATNARPTGWTEQLVSGTALSWDFVSGGINGNPPSAYEGPYNARLFKNSGTPSVSKLISPSMNLLNADSATLQFWHAQALWPNDQDELRVYYRTSAAGAWNLLTTYTQSITDWTQRTISLPNLSSSYYLAFEGTAKYGFGVCLDQIVVSTTSSTGNWLSINGGSSVSGTINSGAANHALSVGFDASGLSAGTYNSDITIESNSATNSLVTIPVSLTVLAPLGVPQEPEIEFLANGTSARISWNAIAGSPTGYKLYFCALPDFSSGVSLLATTAASRLYYVDNAAGSRPKGFYRVVAYR